MYTEFFTIGLLMLLTAIVPGPDFAIVAKNTLFHSRRAGWFTSLGIGCALIIHLIYCNLGLGIVIYNSLLVFTTIKLLGAIYLFYLGYCSLFRKNNQQIGHSCEQALVPHHSLFVFFKEGFICNILNPKVSLFFISIFSIIINNRVPMNRVILLSVEMVMITILWFFVLTILLSSNLVFNSINKYEPFINKFLGILFISFGFFMIFY